MLEYKRDRLDYGELLVPPKGYVLDRGIATVFSLSLDCLLSVPVALIYAQTMDGKLDTERFQLLEAIQQISKKITVYHNRGQLRAPSRYNRLYAFLEDILVPVDPGSAFAAFHPKVWILRYVAEDAGPVRYRVMIMSRNLTLDRNWDVAACLEGAVEEGSVPQNESLVDLLHHLNQLSPFPQAETFIGDFAKTSLNAPNGVKTFDFLPSGFPGHKANPLAKESGNRLAVVAPFIDEKGLDEISAGVKGDCYLFSRRYELMKLSSDFLARFREIYQFSELVLDGDLCLDETLAGEDVHAQDLHAKLFVFDQGKQASWVLGSSNATAAAMHRNLECMVRMTGKKKDFGVDRLLDDLLGPKRELAVFEPFSPEDATGEDPEAELRDKLRTLQYALNRLEVEAVLTQAQNESTYDLALTCDTGEISPIEGVVVSIHPLNRTQPQPITLGESSEQTFANIKETEVTQFMVFRVQAGEDFPIRFMVKVELKGLPESRLDSIYKSIVNSREKFFEYLHFLLLDETQKDDLLESSSSLSGKGDDMLWLTRSPIYEQLLVAASRSPKKLRRIDELIARLCRYQEEGRNENGEGEKEEVVPKAFLDFWEVFRSLIPTNPKTKAAEA